MWIQDVIAVLHRAFAFLSRQDFLVNFVANLGGALCGVLLAFWIEHRRTRREATNLYGRLLSTSRSELFYLQPKCASVKAHFRAANSKAAAEAVIPLGSLSLTATRALLVNPLVHEKAPYSLIMTLTALSGVVEDVLRRAPTLIKDRRFSPKIVAKVLGYDMEKVELLMAIALERLNLELGRLGIEVTADPQTEEVSRRLLEVNKIGSEDSTRGNGMSKQGKKAREASAEETTANQEGEEGRDEADATGVERLAPSATAPRHRPR